MSGQTSPLIFLDFDDVLCLNVPYGGNHVFNRPHPDDLWERLFSQYAIEVLLDIVRDHRPKVVLTTSWLRRVERGGFEGIFRATGLSAIADCLDDHWDAPQNVGMSRLQAIESWLHRHPRSERFVVLDDHLSGTGLAGSRIDKERRVVLCEVGIGLVAAHASAIDRALRN